MIKREQMSRTLNPAPDVIEDEHDLTDYHVAFFQDLSILLRQMESRLVNENDAVPVDFNNQLQFLIICSIQRLVNINKVVQKHTAAYLKKGFLFNELRHV